MFDHIVTSLTNLHICTTSLIRGAQQVGALRETYNNKRYNRLLAGWYPFHEELGAPIAELTVCYTTQECIKVLQGKAVYDSLEDLYCAAKRKAVDLATREPWHWAVDPTAPREQFAQTYDGLFRANRLEMTRMEMIELFQDVFDVSYHSAARRVLTLSKIYGPVKPVRSVKGSSARERITEWIKMHDVTSYTRPQLITTLMNELQVERASVNSCLSRVLDSMGIVVASQRSNPVNKSAAAQRSGRAWAREVFAATPNITRDEFIEAALNVGFKKTTAVSYYSSLHRDRSK